MITKCLVEGCSGGSSYWTQLCPAHEKQWLDYTLKDGQERTESSVWAEAHGRKA